MYSSKPVQSNQNVPHSDLVHLWQRYQQSEFCKRYASHTLFAFDRMHSKIISNPRPVILDSGCGTGESSAWLAKKYPEHWVVGIDKSESRLAKNPNYFSDDGSNIIFLRAELVDFWRLLRRNKIPIDRHYLFYPNPWPKKKDVKKRFHGHPVISDLLHLASFFQLRSNWPLYIQEFELAVRYWLNIQPRIRKLESINPITRFEKKYLVSGHQLYELSFEHILP